MMMLGIMFFGISLAKNKITRRWFSQIIGILL
jgi:hypothetical protein